MASKKKITRRGVTLEFTIDNALRYNRFFNQNLDLVMKSAMVDLQRRAILAMAEAYKRGKASDFQSRHKKYKNRPDSRKIEHAIFGGSVEATISALKSGSGVGTSGTGSSYVSNNLGVSPPRGNKNGPWKMTLFNKPLALIRRSVDPNPTDGSKRIRHFDIIDTGAKAKTSKQVYLDAKKLSRRLKRDRTVTLRPLWRPLKETDIHKFESDILKTVRVPHSATRARNFTLAAVRVFKTKKRIKEVVNINIEKILKQLGLKTNRGRVVGL